MSKGVGTKRLVLTALFTALIVAGGFIRIPVGTVPITLQTLFVLLAGSLGGKRIGAASCGIYLALGLVGSPVFSAGGGMFYIFKPTFGYLLGFVMAGAIAGIAKSGFIKRCLFNVLGVLAVHLMGVTYFYCISNFYLDTPLTLTQALLTGSVIFLPVDMLSALLGAFVSYKLAPVLKLS